MSKVLFLVVSALIITTNPLSAENIYSWVDEAGVTHYASKPVHEKAQAAKLPEIMRGEFQSKTPKLESCVRHGGIDCQAGADADGSVICMDGFTGAAPPYRFSCNSPKLAVADISDLSSEGKFSVFLRNSKSVVAKSPSVFFNPSDGVELKLKGPAQIEPFGMGEFVFEDPEGKALAQPPSIAQLKITCANCSG